MMITKMIEDICDVSSGGTPSRGRSSFFGGSIQWVKSGELRSDSIYCSEETLTEEGLKNSSAKIYPPNTVLLAMYGATVGKVSILRVPAAVNQAICVMQIKNNELTPEYLYYFFKSQEQSIIQKAAGGGQPNISAKIVKKLKITYSDSLEEQRAIAAALKNKLDAIASIEEKTKKQMEELEAWVQAINRETLTCYDTPQELRKFCQEDKRIVQPYTDECKQLKYLGMENIDKDTWQYTPSSDSLEAGNSTTYYYDSKHLLYGKLRPYLKKVFLPTSAGRCSTELIPFLPNNNIEREFLALLITSDEIVNAVMDESTGSRMPRANIQKLLSYKVSVPDISIQQKRLAVCREKMQTAEKLGKKLNEELQNLSALRSALYREAFWDGE